MTTTKIAQEVTINGHALTCPVCKGRKFWHRQTLMNTVGLSLFNLDWLNKKADNKVCQHCGYIYWFMPVHKARGSTSTLGFAAMIFSFMLFTGIILYMMLPL